MIDLMLQDKKVLITGAGRGIGAAIAHAFASQGAEVFLSGRNLSTLEKLSGELNDKYQCEAKILVCDVADLESIKSAFKALYTQAKGLDVLINNAGVLDDALLGMTTPEQVQNTFNTNTFGTLYCSQYASRLMQRKKQGCIINITSIFARVGNPGQVVYSGSKAAIIGMTKSMAKELASANIRVNAIAPGFIDTDMTQSLPSDKYQQRIDSIAMGHIGEAEDVANAALYLASDMAKYVTGQVLGVDGGMLI